MCQAFIGKISFDERRVFKGLKCPPVLLIKKVLPAFLVAFTSASGISAFQIGMETCEKKLGVDKHLTSFLYPLGSVIYMPSSVMYFTVLVCTFAETYQIAVSIPWLIMAVVQTSICLCYLKSKVFNLIFQIAEKT